MRSTGLKQSSLSIVAAARASLYKCLHPQMAVAIALVCVLLLLPARVFGQVSFSRSVGREMLKDIRRDMKENYYDSSFHGKDLDAHFRAAEEMLAKAETTEQVYAIVAQALMDLDDSHLYLVPPEWTARVEYGWKMQMIGDAAYVIAVKPGSSAETKGLRPGDQVISVDGFAPERATMWKMNYYYNALAPKSGVVFAVKGADGKSRQLAVASKIMQGKLVQDEGGHDWYQRQIEYEKDAELYKSRVVEVDEDGLMIWKMPTFALDKEKVDETMNRARKHKALILDLRGNSGGYVDTMLGLIGNFFDHDVKLGEVKSRRESRPLLAKTRGGNAVYKGNLIILIDSESASASETFARTMQLERRATVVGDRSKGAVMVSRFYTHKIGLQEFILYGVNVTIEDLIMKDGQSLEHTGVIPDELLLPTGADLAAGRDPVLARAAALAGVKLDAEKAGALFPVEWRK